MQVYPTTQHLDRDGQHMGLRAALRLVGRHMFHGSWKDTDAEILTADRDAAVDTEAWDRARGAELHLERLIVDRIIQSFGEDDEGALSAVTLEQITKPYFRFSACRGFLAQPDGWATMYVDGPQLRTHLSLCAGLRPRQNTYKWLPIANEAWRFGVREQAIPRTQAAIIAHVQDWCSIQFGKQADEKDLKPLARAIVECLGSQRLGVEVSQEEAPPEIGI